MGIFPTYLHSTPNRLLCHKKSGRMHMQIEWLAFTICMLSFRQVQQPLVGIARLQSRGVLLIESSVAS